jgi:hypothetical protein
MISRRGISFHDRKLTRRHRMTDLDLNLTLHLSGDSHTNNPPPSVFSFKQEMYRFPKKGPMV